MTDLDEPILSDGIRLRELFDMDRRTVQLRVYADPEIFDLEQQRLFTRSWMVVGHESEIRSVGSYVTRYLGNDPVIVTRTTEGEISVLLNVCSHRGMQLCRASEGEVRNLRCPYHGWVYALDGQLRSVSLEGAMYPDGIDKTEFALENARAETRHGWIFATFDRDAPELSTYLGPLERELDLVFGRTESGIEVIGPPQRWRVNANWKLAAEQFSGDAYHYAFLHRWATQFGRAPSGERFSRNRSIVQWAEAADDYESAVEAQGGSLLPVGLTPELYAEYRAKAPESLRQLLDGGINDRAQAISVFPTFYGLFLWEPHLDGRLGPMMSPRLFNPRAVDEMEVWMWAVAEKDAPEELKELTMQTTVQNFGSSGLYEQDDAETWVSIQRGTSGCRARQRTASYESTKSADQLRNMPGWSDDAQWSFWMRWLAEMTGDTTLWPSVPPAERSTSRR